MPGQPGSTQGGVLGQLYLSCEEILKIGAHFQCQSFSGSWWVNISNSTLVASSLIKCVHVTKTEQLNKIHELLPNPTFAYGATSFCKTELCVAAASEPLMVNKHQWEAHQDSLQEAKEKLDTQVLCPGSRSSSRLGRAGAPHCTLTSSLPRGGAASPLSSLLRASEGWKSKPRGSSAVSGCNYSGRTDFLWVPNFQIRESRKLGHSTPPHCPSFPPPQKESFLSSYRDTVLPVSATKLSVLIRASCVPTSNPVRKWGWGGRGEKNQESRTSAGCHIHLHNWINNLHFENGLSILLHECCSKTH